jgi:uncharacterized protein YndB with AHSA1/START domain
MRVKAERRFPVSSRTGFEYITDQSRWPEYWPGLVRIEPGSRWSEAGDVTRIVVRLLRREIPIEMTLHRFEPHRLVEYTSRQPGLPDARHVRSFEDAGGELRYRIAVELAPRGLYDRVVVRWGIARALRQTLANLDEVFSRYP